MLQITCYNVITTVFYDDVLRQISYIELLVGLGLGLGPTIGSVLFTALGYEWTMYAFGFIDLAALVVVQILLPKQMNNMGTLEDEKASDNGALLENEDKKKDIKVTWCLLLKNKHFSYTLLICFFGTINIVYFYGYIGPYLLRLGCEEKDIGFIIAS
jgi:predicted MFS family arabinose efflux permease